MKRIIKLMMKGGIVLSGFLGISYILFLFAQRFPFLFGGSLFLLFSLGVGYILE